MVTMVTYRRKSLVGAVSGGESMTNGGSRAAGRQAGAVSGS